MPLIGVRFTSAVFNVILSKSKCAVSETFCNNIIRDGENLNIIKQKYKTAILQIEVGNILVR